MRPFRVFRAPGFVRFSVYQVFRTLIYSHRIGIWISFQGSLLFRALLMSVCRDKWFVSFNLQIQCLNDCLLKIAKNRHFSRVQREGPRHLIPAGTGKKYTPRNVKISKIFVNFWKFLLKIVEFLSRKFDFSEPKIAIFQLRRLKITIFSRYLIGIIGYQYSK